MVHAGDWFMLIDYTLLLPRMRTQRRVCRWVRGGALGFKDVLIGVEVPILDVLEECVKQRSHKAADERAEPVLKIPL